MGRPKKNKKELISPITDRVAGFNILRTQYDDLDDPVEAIPIRPEDCLQSPSIGLDLMCNEGGFRPGSIIEWYGMEGLCKTWFALEMCREAQRKHPEKIVAYIDTEYAVDEVIARDVVGINTEPFEDGTPRFILWPRSQSDVIPDFEQVMNRLHKYAASNLFSLIVLDSVAATMSNWEQKQEDITDTKVCGSAKEMMAATKKLRPICAMNGTIIWMINRMAYTSKKTPVGEMWELQPGGGNSIRFTATHRFRVAWKEHTESNIAALRVKSDKMKYGPDKQEIIIPFVLGQGVNKEADLLVTGERVGVIKRSSNGWYSFKGFNIGQGLENAADLLREKVDMSNEIRKMILDKHFNSLDNQAEV